MSGVHAARGPIQTIATSLRWSGTARSVARTAGFNVASAAAAGIGGIILARTVGPTIRGEYAAITSWFGVALMVGGMGQPAALCFYVARDRRRATEYVATSRAMMLVTGSVVLITGLLLAPVLAHGLASVVLGYEIVFGASIVAFVGASYTFSLQARDLRSWNVVRVSQPVLSVLAIGIMCKLGVLTLDHALVVLPVTMVVQLGWAYWSCRRVGLVPGHVRSELFRPLAVYGAAQIAALTPATLNAQLDQLVLSQTVPRRRSWPLCHRRLLDPATSPLCLGDRERRLPAARRPAGCDHGDRPYAADGCTR